MRSILLVLLLAACGELTGETALESGVAAVSISEVRLGRSAWVELHNSGGEPAEVGGWRVVVLPLGVDSNVEPTELILPDDALIAPGAYRVVPGLALPRGQGAGQLTLVDSEGTSRSRLAWSEAVGLGRAIGPVQDGAGLAMVYTHPTPMAANALPVDEPGDTAAGLDLQEVSWGQYAACVQSRACRSPRCQEPADATLPVTCVSWTDATSYCEFVGRRLPTLANVVAALGSRSASVDCADAARPGCSGLFSANRAGADVTADGVMHLLDNVTEWVADSWSPHTLFSPAVLRGVVGGAGGYAVPDGDGLVQWFEEPTAVSGFRGFRCAQ